MSKPKVPSISIQELKTLLVYNQETGELTWSNTPPRFRRPGSIAGRTLQDGYRQIMVKKSAYQAHRLAWAIFYGDWPRNQIDHINGVRDDNRISNLRDVTSRNNQCNRIEHRNGRLVGAKPEPRCNNRWRASIKVDGHDKFLGLYNSEDEAHKVYIEYKRRLEEAKE